MDWRHSTWQCAACRFKLGCCEGESGRHLPESDCDPPPEAGSARREAYYSQKRNEGTLRLAGSADV
jgi:hypothetical protein